MLVILPQLSWFIVAVLSDSNRMPPPPLPTHRPPTTGSTTPSSSFSSSLSPSGKDSDFTISSPAQDISPSTYFANLSLLSPVVDQSNSISLKESLSFSAVNQQTPSRLSRSLPLQNVNRDALHSVVPLARPSSPSVNHKRERLAPYAEVDSSPSPVHLLSPIDGNLTRAESNTVVPRPSHDSTQMLLSLPQFEGDRMDGEPSGCSHVLEPTSIQPSATSPSPSFSEHVQSPPSTSAPSPDPQQHTHVESLSAQQSSPVPQKVKTSFKDFLMRKKRQQEEHVEPTASTSMNNLQTEAWHAGMPNGNINSESEMCDGDGRNEASEKHLHPGSPNFKPYQSPARDLDVSEDPIYRDSKSASLEDIVESEDTCGCC
jgi:hypothetical protein